MSLSDCENNMADRREPNVRRLVMPGLKDKAPRRTVGDGDRKESRLELAEQERD